MDYAAPSAPATYYDRSTGLMVFGILTIGLGLLSIGLAVLLLGSQAFGPAPTAPGVQPMPIGALIPGMLVYVVAGIGLIWTGVGSCLARRWACALLRIFSWAWLVIGVMCFLAAAVVMPMMLLSAPSAMPGGEGADGVMGVVLVIILGFYSIIFIVFPAVWTWFYNSRHVRLTCEARDPVVRWTDRCPLPVLAVSIWAVTTMPIMLLQAFTGYAVVPLFGLLIGGFAGGVLFALLATIWAISGVLLYFLDVRGLWLLLGTLILTFVSSVVSYSLHDFTDIYRLMHFPEGQIQQIQKVAFFHNRALLVGMMAVCFLPFIGYLIYLFRFFRPISR